MMKEKQKPRFYTMKGAKWWDKQLLKQIARIGIPLIITSMLFSLTEVSDNISLGIWAPKNAIGIANFAGRLYWIAFLLILMFPSMFGFLAAQYYGAKKYKEERQVVASVIFFSLLTSILSLVVIHVFGKNVLSLFIKEDHLYHFYLEGAYEYVKVFSYLMILEAIIHGLMIGVMAEGKTRTASLISLLVVPFNILFNYVFMKELAMGTIGCAWSTLVSWSIVFVILMIWVVIASKRQHIQFGIRPLAVFRFDGAILRKGFRRIGNGLSNVLAELNIVLVMTVFSKYYTDGIIVTSIINPFFNIIMFVGSGVIGTKAHFVGTKLGAGHFKKAYETDAKINFYGFVLGIANALFIMALAYPIPLIYTKEEAHNKLLATYCLLATGVSYPFIIVASSFVGSLVTGGRSNEAFLANSIQPFTLEVGLLFLIATTTSIPFLSLYLVFRTLRMTRIALSYFFWRQHKWITNETNVPEVKLV